MAAAYNGGVVLGADSRTSTGNYVANRATDKLTQLTDKVTAPVARSARRLPTMSCSCSHTNILARQLCLGQTGSPPTAHFTCFVREGGWNGRSARSRCSGLRGRAGHLPSGAPGAALVPCSPPGHSSTAPGSAPGAPRRQVYVCRSGSAADTQNLAAYVQLYLHQHQMELGGGDVSVRTAARLAQQIVYGNKARRPRRAASSPDCRASSEPWPLTRACAARSWA